MQTFDWDQPQTEVTKSVEVSKWCGKPLTLICWMLPLIQLNVASRFLAVGCVISCVATTVDCSHLPKAYLNFFTAGQLWAQLKLLFLIHQRCLQQQKRLSSSWISFHCSHQTWASDWISFTKSCGNPDIAFIKCLVWCLSQLHKNFSRVLT